jgi:dihydrofolate reductase
MDDAHPFDFRAFHAQHTLAMIVACSENGVIGVDGDLPWHLPRDLRHFMRSTKGCPVIMGRKTFDTLDRPLPDRLNIVLSRTLSPDRSDGVAVARDLDEAIRIGAESGLESPIWIAGGGHIYGIAMDRVDLIVRTLVHTEVKGDTKFPEIDEQRWERARSEHFLSDQKHAYGMTIEWWVHMPTLSTRTNANSG